jgi:hypothetical protein
MPKRECHHVTLAQNHVAHIQRCTDCGCVSIHTGPATLRVDGSVLSALAQVVADAAHAQQHPAEPLRAGVIRGVA